MLSRLVNFLSAPRFEDEEKNRVARILYVIVVTLFIASLVIGTVEFIAGTRTTVPVLWWMSSHRCALLTKKGSCNPPVCSVDHPDWPPRPPIDLARRHDIGITFT
jgi:hypothetical protein